MNRNNHSKNWSQQQDNLIIKLLNQQNGGKNWAKIASQLHSVYNYPKRTGKQCRQRWHNQLDPNINKRPWTKQQQDALLEQHKIHGNKWTLIAEILGRTDNSIKNHFYSTIRKGLRRISKIIGSKNSTLKMKKIKPRTLSKIFSLSELKSQQEFQNGKNQFNYKQIADNLIKISRMRITDNINKVDEQEINKFNKILQQMEKVHGLHEIEKKQQAKMKKEKKLSKKFDEVSESSQSQSQQEQSPFLNTQRKNIKKQKKTRAQISNKKVQLTQIGSKREIKTSVKIDQDERQKIGKKQKKKTKMDLQSENNKKQKNYICFSSVNRQQSCNSKDLKLGINLSGKETFLQNILNQQNIQNQNKQNTEDFDNLCFFNIHLQQMDNNQDSFVKHKEFDSSPNRRIRVSPFAVTPNYESIKQLNFQHISIKTQQFEQTLNRIRDQVKNNNSNQGQMPQKSVIFQSPSSAFKRPSDSLPKFQYF